MYKFLLRTPLKKTWKRIGLKKRAGVIFPLFSIFSKKSLGIGEISDLKLAVDWCKITGNTILQILPLNDTGFDFYPYSPQSSFAVDPVYLSLRNLIGIEKEGLEKEYEDLIKKFSIKTKFINWKIKGEKLNRLWQIFFKRAKFSLRFQKFVKKQSFWLENYALFRVLKEIHKEKSWEEWEEDLKNREEKSLLEFRKKYRKQIEFQKWLQWQLFEQLRKIKNYAQKKEIFLKGDLPLFVSRDSADCWSKRKYFKLDFSAGAPPDLFSPKGQRWGYPPYNFDEIFKDNFIGAHNFLCARLKYAQNFYDLFRIDHLVGIFRTWSIPIEAPFEKQGRVGFFDPKNENIWEERGRKILKLIIENTKMLPCAEDLGTVPHFCSKFLEELGIPGLNLQRWKKNWQNFEFISPKEYRKISVATLSTHDLNNFPAWWEREAGGISKELFKIKCKKAKIDFERVRKKLFYSRGNYLFWKEKIDEKKYIEILGRPAEGIKDIVKIFRETLQEKEKFWKMISLKGEIPPRANKNLIGKNLELINSSTSIFVILPIFEWLFLGDILKGNPSQYRVNFPGKVSKRNFSLRLPISLEKLLNLQINKAIKKILEKTSRIN